MNVNLTDRERQIIINELKQGLYQESPTRYDAALKRIIKKMEEAE